MTDHHQVIFPSTKATAVKLLVELRTIIKVTTTMDMEDMVIAMRTRNLIMTILETLIALEKIKAMIEKDQSLQYQITSHLLRLSLKKSLSSLLLMSIVAQHLERTTFLLLLRV